MSGRGSESPRKAETIGEELWEAHLTRNRDADAASDVDVVHSKDMNDMSVGEELWRIHCLRAGKELDKDYEEVGAAVLKKGNETEKVISLRNRNIKVEE